MKTTARTSRGQATPKRSRRWLRRWLSARGRRLEITRSGWLFILLTLFDLLDDIISKVLRDREATETAGLWSDRLRRVHQARQEFQVRLKF